MNRMDLQMAYLYPMGFMFFLFNMVSWMKRFVVEKLKRLGFVVCLWVLGNMSVMADDSLLVRIEERSVCLSEFLWHLNRSGERDVNQYFQRFLKLQLEVADAKRRRLDTLPDFRRQSEFLQARVLKKYFINRWMADSCHRHLTAKLVGHHAEKGWLRVDVFTYRLSQHATDEEENKAIRVMNTWAERLKGAGVPKEADLKWAHDKGIQKQFGSDEWIPAYRLLKEFLRHQENLSIGSWSEPFESPLGMHVIRIVDRKDKVDDEIFSSAEYDFQEQELASYLAGDSDYNDWLNGKLQLPLEVQYGLNWAYEGLLATYWQYNSQLATAEGNDIDPSKLRAYFRNHKNDYRWEFPHFKGAVIHCLNKKTASKIKKKLKKLPMDSWKEALARFATEDSIYVADIECGLFQIGKNPYVDRLAFKCGSFTPHDKLPYTFLLGKKLKKGPEDYTDVLSKVTSDYLRQCENDRFSQLFARFNVEIDKDVLKTVNSCGNK